MSPKKKIKFFCQWAESECSPRKVQAKSKKSPSKVQAKSEQNPSRIENNLCSDCAWTPQTMFRLCSDYSDCPRTVLGLLGLSSESTRTMWGRVKYCTTTTMTTLTTVSPPGFFEPQAWYHHTPFITGWTASIIFTQQHPDDDDELGTQDASAPRVPRCFYFITR